jgi:uncharacterized protein (TIGR02594 family)
MRLPTRLLLAAGCGGLLALGSSALSAPVSRGIAHRHRAQHLAKNNKSKMLAKRAQHGVRNVRHKTIAQRAAWIAAMHRVSPHAAHEDRAARLASMPVAKPPQRPAFGWPILVREARKYIGTNPTARTKLWCATFMNFVLAKVGYAGINSDAARSFATYGHRIPEPRSGAIAMLTRGRNGGHVGVVSGVDPHGNPIIISGNHGRRVGEGIYSRSRVIAYVMPSERRPASEIRVAERATPAMTNSLSAVSRASSGPAIESPIAELVAAIQVEQGDSQAKVRPVQRPAPPPAPHRTVQQLRVRPQHVAQRPVEHLARHAAPPRHQMLRRDLPLDPALARLLGIKTRAQAPHHRLHANHFASAR